MGLMMIAWIYVLGIALVCDLLSTPSLAAPAPAGLPHAPHIDPFAPPPPPNYPTHMHYAPPPPMPPNGGYPQPPPQNYYPPPHYNHQQYPAANMVNPPPRLPPVNNNPPVPPNAAPLGATGPSYSSGAEQEFEGDKTGSSGYGYQNTAYYPPQPAQAYYGPPQTSLLDAYYHTPQHGYHGYSYPQQQRRQNDLFGGLFGGTPGGNLFGALMINEYVF